MFKFRLQRVLDLRVKREQAVAVQLAEAQRAEEEARAHCETLQRQRDEGAQRAAPTPGSRPTAGQLQNLRLLVDRMTEQVAEAQGTREQAERRVQEVQQELATAFKDRRIIDRLRERDLADWRANQTHADRQLMDDIALGRFVRTSSTASTPPEEQ